MSRQRLKKTALIWFLALVTVAWGGVVAGHQHPAIDHGQCETCLLAPLAGATPDAPAVDLAPVGEPAIGAPGYRYATPPTTHYHSRAPPA
ncbi:MAG: hypothetical protein WC247_01830 [Porticoccaceae bacterium]|jgi:hypothetical protein